MAETAFKLCTTRPIEHLKKTTEYTQMVLACALHGLHDNPLVWTLAIGYGTVTLHWVKQKIVQRKNSASLISDFKKTIDLTIPPPPVQSTAARADSAIPVPQ
jgi:hypothetical protein